MINFTEVKFIFGGYYSLDGFSRAPFSTILRLMYLPCAKCFEIFIQYFWPQYTVQLVIWLIVVHILPLFYTFLAELRRSRTRLIIWWMLSGCQLFRFRTISSEWNVWSTWNLVHTCLVVREGSLLILRIIGQRSRSQLLKIEQIIWYFFRFCTIS